MIPTEIVELLNDLEVSSKLVGVPHPYTLQDALDWIDLQPSLARNTSGYHFAVESLVDQNLIGSVGLSRLSQGMNVWEFGYWFGTRYWGQGFATEAASAVKSWATRQSWVYRLRSGYLPDNAASGRVLEKLGFARYGQARASFLSTGTVQMVERLIWPPHAETADLIEAHNHTEGSSYS